MAEQLNQDLQNLLAQSTRYESQLRASKNYHEKMKDNEDYKKHKNENAKNYYARNKEIIKQKKKERYQKEREALRQAKEMFALIDDIVD